jgi:hypothetical protein
VGKEAILPTGPDSQNRRVTSGTLVLRVPVPPLCFGVRAPLRCGRARFLTTRGRLGGEIPIYGEPGEGGRCLTIHACTSCHQHGRLGIPRDCRLTDCRSGCCKSRFRHLGHPHRQLVRRALAGLPGKNIRNRRRPKSVPHASFGLSAVSPEPRACSTAILPITGGRVCAGGTRQPRNPQAPAKPGESLASNSCPWTLRLVFGQLGSSESGSCHGLYCRQKSVCGLVRRIPQTRSVATRTHNWHFACQVSFVPWEGGHTRPRMTDR